MDQREDRRWETGAATKVDVSVGLPCRWPPKREYTPRCKTAVAILTGYAPPAALAR